MFTIYKLRADHVIDFAAEELKKYLRMMMLQLPEIDIVYDPKAKTGFRLGLMEDHGLANDVDDPVQDDLVYIDTDTQGGILAGSNTRSVLFAVYRFLRLNGCRFFAPGVDGEFIPRRDITPQKYRKVADYRMRAHTIEGRPSMQNVLAYLDYHAKQELNTFAPYTPFVYMARWYLHEELEAQREPEPVDAETVEQWHRALEAEAIKRGLMLQIGSHEIVPRVLGIDPKDRELYKRGELVPTEEMKSRMAMINGVRDLYRNDPFNTNFCMSRADLRARYVDIAAEEIKKNRHLTRFTCCLADQRRNHCECPECRKLHPSDFLVMMMNDLDERLTAEGIDTKVTFSTYVDQQFAPSVARIKNPSRFMLTYPPISRTYAASLDENSVFPQVVPYQRNAWTKPRSVEESMAYFRKWQEIFPGDCSTYEYHFWVHQYRDPSLMAMSRRVYKDVRSLKLFRMSGINQDGSNKSFFPHGFMSYIFAETLVDREVDYEALKNDYFSHAYGADWEKVVAYFEKMSELFDHAYMCGDKSIPGNPHSIYYNPAHVKNLEAVKELTKEGIAMSEAHKVMPTRMQTIHWRLMRYHAMWCVLIADAMIEKCQGHDQEAIAKWKESVDHFSQYDVLLDPWFDMSQASVSYRWIMRATQSTHDI